MQNPASLVPLKNIFLLWTESSARSALNCPLSTWSEAEDAIHTMAALACDPERAFLQRGNADVRHRRGEAASVVNETKRHFPDVFWRQRHGRVRQDISKLQ
jgi:hypothetical protein